MEDELARNEQRVKQLEHERDTLADRHRKVQAVLVELGDGAVNMGAFHESLNLASLWGLPVVFLVVNNEYGMGTSVARASAEPELYRRAAAYRMHGERVDGNDVQAVIEASDRLLTQAREERRPALLEAMTYRVRGHSVADAGLAYRTKEEIEERRHQDPLTRTRESLEARGAPLEGIEALEAEVEAEVEAAVAYAEADAPPPVDRLAAGVYAAGSEEQFERMRPGSPVGEEELVFAGGLGK
jgi:pyruvate dehydrogenase E1 component alpha subunit